MDKESLKNWLKNPLNVTLLLVILTGFVIRLYYFSLTAHQPLWWDEAVYGSLAKNQITGQWSLTEAIQSESIIRPFLLPFLWSILLRAGFPEIGFRFVLEFLPSVLSIFAVYLIAKEFYGKRTGIISAFIFSFLWIHLFYTSRILTGVPSLAFILFSVYFLALSIKDDFKPKFFGLSILLLNFAVLMRYPNGLVFFAYLALIIISGKLVLMKNKKFWLSGILGMVPLLIFFAYNLVNYGNIFPAIFGVDYLQASADSFAFHVLNFSWIYLKTPFFVLFLIGLAVLGLNLLFGYDLIKKRFDLKGTTLLILFMVFFYGYFIFIQRGAEDRWLFPTALPLVIFAGYGASHVYDYVKKQNKNIALALVLIILAFGAYSQITHSQTLIVDRSQSFLQIRQGFEWMKENTPEDSVIIGHAIQPYAMYYAERDFIVLDKESPIQIQTTNANYLVVHAFRPHPDYLTSYLQSQNRWRPIQVWFFDAQQTQPAFIIYQRVG